MALLHVEFALTMTATHPKTGARFVETIAWDPSWNWDEVFMFAHQNEDGSYPTALHLRSSPLWGPAYNLRVVEDRLKKLCEDK